MLLGLRSSRGRTWAVGLAVTLQVPYQVQIAGEMKLAAHDLCAVDLQNKVE